MEQYIPLSLKYEPSSRILEKKSFVKNFPKKSLAKNLPKKSFVKNLQKKSFVKNFPKKNLCKKSSKKKAVSARNARRRPSHLRRDSLSAPKCAGFGADLNTLEDYRCGIYFMN